MKDPITVDLSWSFIKTVPPIIASAAGTAQGWDLADLAMLGTVLFTAAQFFNLMVKNWGEWMGWFRDRWTGLAGLWARLRGRG